MCRQILIKENYLYLSFQSENHSLQDKFLSKFYHNLEGVAKELQNIKGRKGAYESVFVFNNANSFGKIQFIPLTLWQNKGIM
jgi:hypothetical protein